MDTMTTDKKKRVRRNHTPALKAQILAECAAPGASVARVAMAHGINANIVHGWRKLAREQALARTSAPVATPVSSSVVAPTFVPLAIEAMRAADDRIQVEVRRGGLSMTIAWPRSAAADLAVWTRELLR
jgi:transposase